MPIEWYRAALNAPSDAHPDRLRVRFLQDAAFDRYDTNGDLRPWVMTWMREFTVTLWPGELLISQKQLAGELGVNPDTIRRRLNTLEDQEGWEVFALYYSSMRVKHRKKAPQHRVRNRDTPAVYPLAPVGDTKRLRDKPVGTLISISNYGALTSNTPNKDRLAGLKMPGYTHPHECGIPSRTIPTSEDLFTARNVVHPPELSTGFSTESSTDRTDPNAEPILGTGEGLEGEEQVSGPGQHQLEVLHRLDQDREDIGS